MTSSAPNPVTGAPTTDAWGIDASWLDALDEEHTIAQATIDRLREVIGTPPEDLLDRAPIVARPGSPPLSAPEEPELQPHLSLVDPDAPADDGRMSPAR